MTFHEQWTINNSIDNNILYNTGIAALSVNLMTPNGVEQINEIDAWVKNSEKNNEQNNE